MKFCCYVNFSAGSQTDSTSENHKNTPRTGTRGLLTNSTKTFNLSNGGRVQGRDLRRMLCKETPDRQHRQTSQTDITDRGVREIPTPGRHHQQASPTKTSRKLLRYGDSPRSDNATASERLTLSDYSEMMTNHLPLTQIGYSVPEPNYLSLSKCGSFLGSTSF